MGFRIAVLLISASSGLLAAGNGSAGLVKVQTLAQSTASWDGTPYRGYPEGQPQISVLKVALAPNAVMKWHSHPVPSAGYVLSGDLTVEKQDGTMKHFAARQALTEVVATIHRGVAGKHGAVLIVFYAGSAPLPLSQQASGRNGAKLPAAAQSTRQPAKDNVQ